MFWKVQELKGLQESLQVNSSDTHLVSTIQNLKLQTIYFVYTQLHDFIVPDNVYLIIFSKTLSEGASNRRNVSIFYDSSNRAYYKQLFDKMNLLDRLVHSNVCFKFNLKGETNFMNRISEYINISSRLAFPFYDHIVLDGISKKLYSSMEIQAAFINVINKILFQIKDRTWTFLEFEQTMELSSRFSWAVMLMLASNGAIKVVCKSKASDDIYYINQNVVNEMHSKLELPFGDPGKRMHIDKSNDQLKSNKKLKRKEAVLDPVQKLSSFLIEKHDTIPVFEHYTFQDFIRLDAISEVYKAKITSGEYVFESSKCLTSAGDALNQTAVYAYDYFKGLELDEAEIKPSEKAGEQDTMDKSSTGSTSPIPKSSRNGLNTPENNNRYSELYQSSSSIPKSSPNASNASEFHLNSFETSMNNILKSSNLQSVNRHQLFMESIFVGINPQKKYWKTQVRGFGMKFTGEHGKKLPSQEIACDSLFGRLKLRRVSPCTLSEGSPEIECLVLFLRKVGVEFDFIDGNGVEKSASIELWKNGVFIGVVKELHFCLRCAKAALGVAVLEKIRYGDIKI